MRVVRKIVATNAVQDVQINALWASCLQLVWILDRPSYEKWPEMSWFLFSNSCVNFLVLTITNVCDMCRFCCCFYSRFVLMAFSSFPRSPLWPTHLSFVSRYDVITKDAFVSLYEKLLFSCQFQTLAMDNRFAVVMVWDTDTLLTTGTHIWPLCPLLVERHFPECVWRHQTFKYSNIDKCHNFHVIGLHILPLCQRKFLKSLKYFWQMLTLFFSGIVTS